MPRFSRAFKLGKPQAALDFVDVRLETDLPLFVDPFALSQRLDRFSVECHRTLVAFFQQVVDDIRGHHDDHALELLSHLREPNETRLGFSRGKPQGAGIGPVQAEQLFTALQRSAAVRTGFLTSLEETELVIDGIGRDKISDLTTNVIRRHLVDYTAEQCKLHEVPITDSPLPARFDAASMAWVEGYVPLPRYRGVPILLVPKAFVRYDPSYNAGRYYRGFVVTFLQAQALEVGSGLVRTLKDKQVAYKKDIERAFPMTKRFLLEFSQAHPEVLRDYREALTAIEQVDRSADVDEKDDPAIAEMLAVAVKNVSPGTDRASEYHRLIIGVVEFLFFPQLLYPIKEKEINEGRKRIDIVMHNGAHSGVFHWLWSIRRLPCAYVYFECKNYTTEVGNPELDQLAGRFSVQNGRVGFLCCRRFEDRQTFVRRCRDTFTAGQGLILPLEDRKILELLDLVRTGRRGEVDAKLRELVDEVSL